MDDWKIPSELVQPIPRPTVPTEAHQQRILTSVALCGIPMLVIVVVVGWNARHFEQLKARGHSTLGVIEQLYTSTNGNEIIGHVTYTYRATDGHLFEGQATAPPAIYGHFYLGERLRAFYLPSNESVSTLDFVLQTIWAKPWKHFCAQILDTSIVLTILFMSMILYSQWTFHRAKKLLSNGVATHANISFEKQVQGRLGIRRWRTCYQYHDQTGQTFTKVELRFNQIWLETDSPTVLYDPKNPRRSILYPPLLAKIRHRPVQREVAGLV